MPKHPNGYRLADPEYAAPARRSEADSAEVPKEPTESEIEGIKIWSWVLQLRLRKACRQKWDCICAGRLWWQAPHLASKAELVQLRSTAEERRSKQQPLNMIQTPSEDRRITL